MASGRAVHGCATAALCPCRAAQPLRSLAGGLQADPTLPGREPALLDEFEAAPWLLPPRTKALKYAGVTSLEQLLPLRAAPQGKYEKAVTLLTFTRSYAAITQNTSERTASWRVAP